MVGGCVQIWCNASTAEQTESWPAKPVISSPIANGVSKPPTIRSEGDFRRLKLIIPFFAGAIIGISYAVPTVTSAATISQSEFETLASRCAPLVPITTLEAIAKTESGLHPWALHDNTTSQSEQPGSLQIAFTDARRWLGRGDSVDVGLMQINAANLSALNMTVAAALDPCASLSGGAVVLKAAYGGGPMQPEQEAALLIALSRYNTGTPFRGIMNGYARTVLENAATRQEVRSIPLLAAQASLFGDPNAPPPWNVSAAGVYAQQHGASWIVDLAPPSSAGLMAKSQLVPAVREQLPTGSIASFPTQPTTR